MYTKDASALVVAWMFILTGCDQHDELTMGAQLDTLEQELIALRTESDAHDRNMIAALDLTAMQAEEQRHYSAATGQMDEMGGMMAGMGQMCRHEERGHAPDVASLSGQATDLRAECERHRANMAVVSDTTAARAEEARHREAMGGMLEGMQRGMQGMRGEAGQYRCGSGDCAHCS